MARKIMDETEDLFPGLDIVDPMHKAVFAAAKKFHKENSSRQQLLSESKLRVDTLRSALVDCMHKAGLTKFRFRGLEVEIMRGEEKAVVKLAEEAGEDDDE